MISKSKFKINETTIRTLFRAAGIDGAKEVYPLGAGEFSAVFGVSAQEREYVIKIAPNDDESVLTYEKGMMKAELFWYRQIRENTSIRVPEIFHEDFSRNLIPTDYFIMEKIPGKPMNQMDFTPAEKTEAVRTLARMAAEIHRIKNDRFGYLQNGLHDDWYQAIRSMVIHLLEDAGKKRKKSKNGEKLLLDIECHKDLLERVEARMVNFDLWAPNILCQRKENGKIDYAWIDPERTFWGDLIADFVALEFPSDLPDKKATLEAYNSSAETPVVLSKEEQIRYAIAQGYLALIMEVEKHYRYTPFHFGWWRNRIVSRLLFTHARRFSERTNRKSTL